MKTSRYLSIAALLIFLSCLSIGSTLAQTNNSVTIQSFSFQPNNLTVPMGTTVIWTNQDSVEHTVTADNGAFDSNNIMPNGGQYSHTFNQSGTYAYHCKIHPTMRGQIQVMQGSAMTGTSGANISSPNTGTDPTYSMSSVYSQYYTMPSGSAAKTHITPPKNYQMNNMKSVTVYFTVPKYGMLYNPPQNYAMPSNNQYQTYSMPYSQYQQNYATYNGGNSLWIQGTSGMTQYVVVPQGASLSLIAVSQAGGNGYLYEIAPGYKLVYNSYSFYPYNQIGFSADEVGQYILLFIIDDKVSNAVVIDVMGSSNYQQASYNQPSYQQPNYQQSNQQSSYQAPSPQQSGYSQTSSNYQSSSNYQTPGY